MTLIYFKDRNFFGHFRESFCLRKFKSEKREIIDIFQNEVFSSIEIIKQGQSQRFRL